jgi:hypothetical protein
VNGAHSFLAVMFLLSLFLKLYLDAADGWGQAASLAGQATTTLLQSAQSQVCFGGHVLLYCVPLLCREEEGVWKLVGE